MPLGIPGVLTGAGTVDGLGNLSGGGSFDLGGGGALQTRGRSLHILGIPVKSFDTLMDPWEIAAARAGLWRIAAFCAASGAPATRLSSKAPGHSGPRGDQHVR